MRKIVTTTIILTAVIVVAFAATVLATQNTVIYTSYSLVPKNVSELARESDLIVIADVEEILPGKLDLSDPKITRIWTDVQLQVERTIKGPSNSNNNGSGSTVEVRLAGGTVDKAMQIVSGEVKLEAGQRVLLFLKKEPYTIWGDHFFVHGFIQGKYLLTSNGLALNENPARNTPEKMLIAEIQQALRTP